MSTTSYRFVPWARRGLAAALPQPVDATVPAHPPVAVEVVVAGVSEPVATSTRLHGPGDVIGLDPSVIVRTTPTAHATSVEPNYLVAVDFDQPELPWAFTPTGVPASGRLAPWLVLVCVRRRDGVRLHVPPGAPLPQLVIDDRADEELPDLAESWAWAHAQLLEDDAGGGDVATALAAHPDRNVSRLVCPRRLAPGESWLACLVPAYDAGRVRGLGGTPRGDTLAPAWSAPSSTTLPVYHHWEFQTGPEGDFESLARRLRPHEADARVGRVAMHVGAALPGFVELPAGDPERVTDMDGALQAPRSAREQAQLQDPSLADVPAAVAAGLREVVRVLADAADGTLDNHADPTASPALGPPLYGGAHARRTTLADGDPTWFAELGTDPRSRVAAGLGAEVLRTYQEEVMEACWAQVGDVLALEAALSRARLSLEAGRSFLRRHLDPLPLPRFWQLTAPLHQRALLAGTALPSQVAITSLPARVTDPAMRRFTAATGRVVGAVAKAAPSGAPTTRARTAGTRLVESLAAGRDDVDPTRFVGPLTEGLPGPMARPDEQGRVDLSRFGVEVTVDRAAAVLVSEAAARLTAQQAERPPEADLVRLRDDLRVTGMVTTPHVLAGRQGAVLHGGVRVQQGGLDLAGLMQGSTTSITDRLLEVGRERRGQAGFLVDLTQGTDVHAMGVGRGGDLVVLTAREHDDVTVATLDRRLERGGAGVSRVLAQLPPGSLAAPTFTRSGRPRPVDTVALRPGALDGSVLVVDDLGATLGTGAASNTLPVAVPVADRAPTLTVPPLVTDAVVIGRFEEAVALAVAQETIGTEPPVPQLVPFALQQARGAVAAHVEPAHTHRALLGVTVSIAGARLEEVLARPELAPDWLVPERLDRVMAHPRLEAAAYSYLAAYDRTRFCPGVDSIPPESITLLATNPRFVAGFMGGLNHETNRELVWRGYPTDGRGTPWRSFWRRTDGRPDITEMHRWDGRDLAHQTTDPEGNLVLLVRGDLLRRYPRTMIVAIRSQAGARRPSTDEADVLLPVFTGQFEPDVSFFGFDLQDADLDAGHGWFFALMEPVTEPRFGFDETADTEAPGRWNDVAWPHLPTAAGAHLRQADLDALARQRSLPGVPRADGVAAAAFQRPFKLVVHADHLRGGE